MLRGRCYRDGRRTDGRLEVGDLDRLASDEGSFVWVDLGEDELAELPAIGEQLGLHAIEIDDVGDRHFRAGVRAYTDNFSIVLRLLGTDEKPGGDHAAPGAIVWPRGARVKAFCGQGFLVTVRLSFPAADMEVIAGAWEAQPDLLALGGGYAAYVLIDRVVDSYLTLVERFEDAADDLEDVIFDVGEREGPDIDIRDRLFRLKRETVLLRRTVTPLREGVHLLASDQRVSPAPLQPYLRDVVDHVVRVDEMLDNVRDLLTSLLELRVAQAANRMNEVIKGLTAWASILLVPTLLSGIWGMNFDHMPELAWRYGYLLALGTIVGSALGLYAWFRFRKHWL